MSDRIERFVGRIEQRPSLPKDEYWWGMKEAALYAGNTIEDCEPRPVCKLCGESFKDCKCDPCVGCIDFGSCLECPVYEEEER